MMTSLLFGGFRSLCSCWEGCRADSQWNCEHFPSFYFITSESWERSILANKYLFARTETVFVFASVCSSSRHRERLKSDSCVAFDQENRHHHHRHTFRPDRSKLHWNWFCICVFEANTLWTKTQIRNDKYDFEDILSSATLSHNFKATSRRRHAHKS